MTDEFVQYGSYVGKSERHDDGFYDKVSEEEVKAQKTAFILMKNPIYSGEKKISKVHKIFPYPSNVGKTDRKGDLLNELMQKENSKAMKITMKIFKRFDSVNYHK